MCHPMIPTDRSAMPKKQPKRGGKENPVYVRYGKAKTSPSARGTRLAAHTAKVPMRTPGSRSPLHRYIAENADSGLSDHELIEQFQEYDCDHRYWDEISSTSRVVIRRCQTCWKIEKKVKPSAG